MDLERNLMMLQKPLRYNVRLEKIIHWYFRRNRITSYNVCYTKLLRTEEDILECPHFPGCSKGFNQIVTHIEEITTSNQIGNATVQAIPIREMVKILLPVLQIDPKALLCETEDCERCNSVRFDIDNRTINETNQ